MRSDNSPIHILVLPSFYPSQSQPLDGIFFRHQAVALQRLGHQVGVTYPETCSIRQGALQYWSALCPAMRDEVEEGLPVVRTKSIRIPKLPDISSRIWIRRAINAFTAYRETYGTPDVIHAHSVLWGGVAAMRIKERFNIPFVISEHRGRFIANEFADERELDETRHPSVLRALNAASSVITVSSQMHAYLERLSPSIKPKLITVPNMVDTSMFTPTTEPKAHRAPFRFVSVGFLRPGKGFDALLHALGELLKEQAPRVHLQIIGGGSQEASLKKLAHELDLSNHVEFSGQLAPLQVAEAMQRSDAFVLASRYESFGVAYIEALASGLPIIGTNAGGPADIVEPENGLLVPPDDPKALSAAMLQMIRDYDKYDRTEIRSRAVARYSQKSVAERVSGVLVDAITGPDLT